MKNRLCETLGIEKPVIQGPMAWSSFAPLVAAVSNAGGLGVLGIAGAPNDSVRAQIQETRKLTDKPFGVNVFMAAPEPLQAELPVLLEEKPAVVYADILQNLSADLCNMFFKPLKEAGIKIIVKASTLADAITAEKCGADVVIAKGWEGGGHVTPESTMTLLPQVARTLSVPVVGSGGIADGSGMAAAISLGADGIEMGTAFLCAKECTIHDNAKKAILAQHDDESVVVFSSIHQPCRQIRNKLSDEVIQLETENPISQVQNELFEKFKPSLKNAMHNGDVENGAVMSGMNAPLITEIRSVAAIIDTTIAGCQEVFKRNSEFTF